MKCFDRYFLRIALVNLAVALVALTVLYVLIDYLAGLDYAPDTSRGAGVLVKVYLYRIPPILYALAPSIVLTGGMFGITRLLRNRELLPLRVAGVRMWRALWAFWLIAAIAGVAMFFLRDRIIPGFSEQALEATGMVGRDSRGKQTTIRDDADNVWWIGSYRLDSDPPVLHNVTVSLTGVDGSLTHMLTAPRLEWRGERWTGDYALLDLSRLSGGARAEPTTRFAAAAVPVALTLTPKALARRTAGIELSFADSWARASAEPDRPDLRMEAYELLTFPLSCLSLLLIGAVVATRLNAANLFIAGAVAVAVALLSYTFAFVGEGLAERGILSAEVAAFGPALLFLAAGIVGLRWYAD
jgi:lipopolysaccharide export LptBFGC system permease protein LptF